jgi:hypothetical protein
MQQLGLDVPANPELYLHTEQITAEVGLRMALGAQPGNVVRAVLLMIVTLTASCVPAMRAARVDPMTALRGDQRGNPPDRATHAGPAARRLRVLGRPRGRR